MVKTCETEGEKKKNTLGTHKNTNMPTHTQVKTLTKTLSEQGRMQG